MNFGVLLKLIVSTDGAARGNPGPSASGYSIRDSDGRLVESNSIYNGIKTNNFAEYNAVIHALQWCISRFPDHKQIEIELYSDSELIVKQLTGKYKVKSRDLLHLNEKAMHLTKEFKSVAFKNVPRSDRRISEVDNALNILLDTMEREK
jgi:ribonuclease HI